nr:Tad domain-containing protein [Rubripirellula sp.]
MMSQIYFPRHHHNRSGAVAIVAAILLVMLLGMVALAIDLGYIVLTRTSMQAATDAACLSGGTELIEGLGVAPAPPASVTASATSIACEYATFHPNGDVQESFLDAERDVQFGWAVFDNELNEWQKNWGEEIPGVGGYNLIGVTMRRSVLGSTKGDGPLPLIFAPVLGRTYSTLETTAAAVIMPAKGVNVGNGENATSDVLPFVIHKRLWEKYRRAQAYYETHGIPTDPLDVRDIMDNETNNYRGTEPTGEPLFGHWVPVNNKPPEFKQDFADIWSCECSFDAQNSVTFFGSDGILEVDIFPRDDYTSGNFGTVDVGSSSNSTSDISRQILYGVSAEDLSYLPGGQLSLPVNLQGDTGVSAGIKDELQDIYGQCRAILLFSTLVDPGNNASFEIIGLAGIRIMQVEMTGALTYKHLSVQLCQSTLSNAIPDIGKTIGNDTTVFTPLVLIE